MSDGHGEVPRPSAAATTRAGHRGIAASDAAARARRRGVRIGAAVAVAAAVAALVIPLTLGGTAGHASAPAAGQPAVRSAPGPVPIVEKSVPLPPWTATVNGHALVPGPTGVPRFDVTSGEKLAIAVTVRVPAHSEMTKFFLGITTDTAGIGPRGPIGMKPVLATAAHLIPGAHEFSVHWTVPRGAEPADGYRLALAAYWPKGTKDEPEAEEGPMVALG